MKFTAFILLVSYSVFFGETLVAPKKCESGQTESTCSMCPMKNMMSKCMKKFPGKKDDTKQNTNCMDCPLFSIVMHESFKNYPTYIQAQDNIYPALKANNLSDYYRQHWKPPNVLAI